MDEKFVAGSLSVAVTAIAPFTSSGAALASNATGGVISAVRDSVFDAVFGLPAASVNAPASTVALNSPSADGVSVNV